MSACLVFVFDQAVVPAEVEQLFLAGGVGIGGNFGRDVVAGRFAHDVFEDGGGGGVVNGTFFHWGNKHFLKRIKIRFLVQFPVRDQLAKLDISLAVCATSFAHKIHYWQRLIGWVIWVK